MQIAIRRHYYHSETYEHITKITTEYAEKDDVLSMIMERSVEFGVTKEYTAIHLGNGETIEISRDHRG